ncbi:hypothetical protein [Paenibacillus mesophilus]|nr:hypothetical protein [Paenibacillus mesophilus]
MLSMQIVSQSSSSSASLYRQPVDAIEQAVGPRPRHAYGGKQLAAA